MFEFELNFLNYQNFSLYTRYNKEKIAKREQVYGLNHEW